MALKENSDTAMALDAVKNARGKRESSLTRDLLSLQDVLIKAQYSSSQSQRLESYVLLRPYDGAGNDEKFVIVKHHNFIWK